MTIEVTERAAEHIRDYVTKHEGLGLRVGISTSGCSGFKYVMGTAERIDAEDTVFERHGAKVVVDAKSLPFVDGMELDYVREGLNQRFTFSNPNAKDHCGCGESFAV